MAFIDCECDLMLWLNNKMKVLDKNSVKIMFFPALTGAVVGSLIAANLPASLLKQIFAVFLFLVASWFIIKEIIDYFSRIRLYKYKKHEF